MITHHPNYLYSIDLDSLNNEKIFKEILEAEKCLIEVLGGPFYKENATYDVYGNFATSQFEKYNTFQFPLSETSKLYRELVKNISPFLDKEQDYALQCWFNVFKKGQNIDWHDHWDPESNVWHGFYCVHVKDSFTEYKLPDIEEIIKVPSKEGRIVFGKSDGDFHRSSPWDDLNSPRVTIAFDIIPYKNLKLDGSFEEFIERSFIPFK
jgi:hypothetical protein